MKKIENEVCHFHIGRSKWFYNEGCKKFKGFKNLQQVIEEQKDYLHEVNRDFKGRFCRPFYVTEGGSLAVSDFDYKKNVGVINFDGTYDMHICKYLEECDENELLLITESYLSCKSGGKCSKSTDLAIYIYNQLAKNYNSAIYLDEEKSLTSFIEKLDLVFVSDFFEKNDFDLTILLAGHEYTICNVPF